MLLSIAGPTDLTLHEVNAAADAITRVAHPDANIIFGAVVDDALGEEVRVTVVAAGFDKVTAVTDSRFESRLSLAPRGIHRGRNRERGGAPVDLGRRRRGPGLRGRRGTAPLTFDAEEDLDIPDFLKS